MIVKLELDEDGNLILPLTEEMCQEAGWNIGDTIRWEDSGNNSYTLKKVNTMRVETEMVLVETVSSFRMRYVIEVPVGKKEWALDKVAMNEGREMSQEHIGEQIISHRVIDMGEYLRVFDEDNAYLKNWDVEKKLDYITEWDEEDHSEYYYDFDRNI